MGKKNKIKKITEKQYMEYVAGLKNEPVYSTDAENKNAANSPENGQSSNGK